jgi:hypothetical protein
MNNEDKRILIELISKEQSEMIMSNSISYENDRYKHLEELKSLIKDNVR